MYNDIPHPVLSPPSYSPSASAVPPYALEPNEDEESLEVAVRPNTPTPRGKFTVQASGLTVRLHEQEFGAGIPTYRQNAIIKGNIEVDRADALAITVKLEGRQTLSITDIGTHDRLLFSEPHELWKKQTESTLATPMTLEFFIPFPVKFIDKNYAGPLIVPPTFEARLAGEGGFMARNDYVLSVVVTIPRDGYPAKQDSIAIPIPINYRPRTRPYLPIPAGLSPFLTTLKTSPEEWHQVITSVPCKDGTRPPLDCHLLIPCAQIYALADTIPFHVQLRGSTESLRLFMGTSGSSTAPNRSPAHRTVPSTSNLAPISPFSLLDAEPNSPPADPQRKSPIVRVYLLRCINVKLRGVLSRKSIVIGEGQLHESLREDPPRWTPSTPSSTAPASPMSSVLDAEHDYSLDWEGEVRCNKDVIVPSFLSGNLHVRDHIVVHLHPSDVRLAAHVEHFHAHPIRFVTDTYRETFIHPSDT
ncbi:hypothetical protein BDW22DRAFT_1430046 [Trametopsis cervina]|nr:hypothetical protein BDW22DRAFT_1430046 [Trametopsis cervina]